MTIPTDAQWLALTDTLSGKRWQLILKRGLDLVVSALVTPLLVVLLIPLGLVIVIDSPGGVFFRQERVGKGGKVFRIFKLRTMRKDNRGLQLTTTGDARITRVGKALRKIKLDELPQVFNVLLGHMSLVGPRPEVPRYVAHYTLAQRQVLLVRPGITDPASIAYRDENTLLAKSQDPEKTYIQEVMPAKLALNHRYIQSFSVWGDIKLLLMTVLAVVGLAGKGEDDPNAP